MSKPSPPPGRWGTASLNAWRRVIFIARQQHFSPVGSLSPPPFLSCALSLFCQAAQPEPGFPHPHPEHPGSLGWPGAKDNGGARTGSCPSATRSLGEITLSWPQGPAALAARTWMEISQGRRTSRSPDVQTTSSPSCLPKGLFSFACLHGQPPKQLGSQKEEISAMWGWKCS